MRIPLMASLIAVFSLVESVAVAAQPATAVPAAPVGLDLSCAAALASRLTVGDDEPVRVLACDPAGRGRAVVALGDPTTASSVAVLVPGSDIDLATLADPGSPDRRPFGWARSLHAAAPDTAVVLWVGYETPVGLGRDAATGRLARAAVPALTSFVDGLHDRPDGPPHLTVIGHSYGAVVVSLAAAELDADDLVLVAGPGARAGSVGELGTSARVWAGRAPGDWIRWVPSLSIGDLGHGADPADPSWGALPLDVADAGAHDGYFRAGSTSLAAIAAVVTGGVRS